MVGMGLDAGSIHLEVACPSDNSTGTIMSKKHNA